VRLTSGLSLCYELPSAKPPSPGISLVFRLENKPLPGFCFLSEMIALTNREPEWWCALRLSRDNFNYGAFLSSAASPLSRSSMSIMLLLPQLRNTLA
jgi:hypothetical protein